MRILSVCPSVCLSVTRVYCDKTVKRSVQIYIPYERTFSLVFWEEEWLVGATPSTWNVGSTRPRWSEIADFQPIITRSSSRMQGQLHLAKKSSINANGKSTTRFPMSLRWSSYVAPKSPKGVSNTQNGRMSSGGLTINRDLGTAHTAGTFSTNWGPFKNYVTPFHSHRLCLLTGRLSRSWVTSWWTSC